MTPGHHATRTAVSRGRAIRWSLDETETARCDRRVGMRKVDDELRQVGREHVLRCERITSSADGAAVLVSEHVFPAHLTEFVVDLPHADASIAPSGLRLVE
jgi:hypothetical protein